jgi:hypothetical protein
MDTCEILRLEAVRLELRRAKACERIWRRRARWYFERQHTAGVLIGIPEWTEPTESQIEAESAEVA